MTLVLDLKNTHISLISSSDSLNYVKDFKKSSLNRSAALSACVLLVYATSLLMLRVQPPTLSPRSSIIQTNLIDILAYRHHEFR